MKNCIPVTTYNSKLWNPDKELFIFDNMHNFPSNFRKQPKEVQQSHTTFGHTIKAGVNYFTPALFTAHPCTFVPPTSPCVLSYRQLKQAIYIFVCLWQAGHLLHDTLESIGTANAAYGNASKKRECASTYTLLCHKWAAIAVCRAAPTHSCRIHSTSGHQLAAVPQKSVLYSPTSTCQSSCKQASHRTFVRIGWTHIGYDFNQRLRSYPKSVLYAQSTCPT